MLILTVVLPAPPRQLFAAEYYWDNDGTATGNDSRSGSNLGGTGTWNTTIGNDRWWQIGAANDTSWTNGTDAAVFWGTSGTVTLGTNISVGGLTFNSTGYVIDTGGNTLTFANTGATPNVIRFRDSVTQATITGAVAGTGNVLFDGGSFGGFINSTITFNGTSASGWSGTTTIANGITVETAGASQALLDTSSITLVGGGLMMTNTLAANNGNRVGSAAITSRGGTITFNNTAAGVGYAETLGVLTLERGYTLVHSVNRNNTGQTQQLTFGGLVHDAASTASIAFVGNSLGGTAATPDARNSIAISGFSATPPGQIIGPWATWGTATAQTDYAKYITTVSGGLVVGIVQANIAGSTQDNWTNAANAYTITTAGQALTGDRIMTALRNSVATGANHLLLNGFKLQTYGILNANGTNAFQVSLGTPTTGTVTTPSGGGNLFMTMGNHGITINAPITDNGGAVTIVAGALSGSGGAQTLTLNGTNTYAGGTVINSGVVSVGANANLGDVATNAAVTFNSIGQLLINTTGFSTNRPIVINEGAQATLAVGALNGTFNGPISGVGVLGVTYGTAGVANLYDLSNFTGAFRIDSTTTVTNGLVNVRTISDNAATISLAPGSTGHAVFALDAGAAQSLTLNQRQFVLAGVAATTTGSGMIRNDATTAGVKFVINTDLLVSGGVFGTRTLARLRLEGTNTEVNEFNGRIYDGTFATGQALVVHVTKSDVGTWALGGNNSYSGGTTVGDGTLHANAANALGTGPVTINAGALIANAAGSLGTGNIALSGGSLTLRNKDAVNSAATLTMTAGTLNLRSDTTNDQFTTAAVIVSTATVVFVNVDQFATGANRTLKLGPVTLSSSSTTSINVSGGNGYGLTLGDVTQTSLTAGTATFTNTLAAPGLLTLASFTSNSTSGAAKLSIASSGTTVITGSITQNGGTLALERLTGGTLILQGSSNFSGSVTISNGTVQTAVVTNALGNTSGITLGTSGILALRGDTNATFGNGTTAYPIGLTASGGTINVDRLNSAAPGTTLTLGTVSMPGAYTLNTTGANGVSLGLGAVTGSTANDKVFNNTISGGGKLVIASYAESDASTRSVTFQGTGEVLFTGNITQNGVNALSVIKAGAGTLTLQGAASTYTGATTISNGVLIVASLDNAVLGTPGSLGASSNAATNLVLGAGTSTGTLRYIGGTASTDRLFTINGSTSVAVIDSSGTGALTFSNTGSVNTANNGLKTLILTGDYAGAANTFVPALGQSANNNSNLIKSGAGTWILMGVNTYQGTTTITQGTLRIGVDSAINSAGIHVTAVAGAAATFDLNGKTITLINGAANGITLSGGDSNSTPTVLLNGGTLNINGDIIYSAANNPQAGLISGGTLNYTAITNRDFIVGHSTSNDISNGVYDLTVSSLITGAPGTLLYTGSGNILLSQTDNSNTSITSIAGGTTLFVTKLADGGATSSIGIGGAGASQLLIDSSTLKYIGTGHSTNRLFQLRGNGSTIDSSGTGALSFTGTAALGLSGTSSRTLTLAGSYTTTANSFAPIISENAGITSLLKSGPGTWIVTGLNTYSGATTISGGTLSVGTLADGGANSNIGKSANIADKLVFSNGTLHYTGALVSTDRLFSLSAGNGTIEASGTGPLTFSNTGSVAFGDSGPHTLTLTGTNSDANTLTPVIGDAVAVSGVTSLVKSGSGTWVLAGANTYTGPTTVSGGVLLVTGSLANTAVSVAGATLKLNGTADGTITVGGGGTLQGTGTAAAAVIQSGGTLSVGNSVGQLTIDGNDVVNGAVLAINGGAKIEFEFKDTSGGPGVGWDYVDLAGGGKLDLTGVNGSNRIILDIASWDPNNLNAGTAANFVTTEGQTYSWLFIEADELIGVDPSALNAAYADYFQIQDDKVFVDGSGPFTRPANGGFAVQWQVAGPNGTGLYVTFAAVPEPGSMLLAGLGSLAAAWYGKRRRRQSTEAAAQAEVAT